MKIRRLVLLTSLFYASQSFAIFCPTNVNQIDVGNTLEQVTAQCGAPDKVKSSKTKGDQPQTWDYYVRMDPTLPGTLKMEINFVHNKAVNMSVNGAGLTSTSICGGTINFGDSMEQIKSVCGEPANVSVSNPPNAPEVKETENLIATYNGPPVTLLIFEDGKLKERK